MQVDPIKPTVKAPGTKRLKLICDDPLSNFAFKYNLRRYITARGAGAEVLVIPGAMLRRCVRLVNETAMREAEQALREVPMFAAAVGTGG